MKNNKRELVLSLISSLLFANLLFANGVPSVTAFEEGEHLNLALSRMDFNRIFVEGEKITKLRYPEGAFILDKSDLNQGDSEEGSVYLKPVSDIPITVFFSTDKGHHFALSITPKDSLGKTLRLQLKRQTRLTYASHDVGKTSDVEEIMGSLKEGNLPEGFQKKPVLSRSFYVKKDLKVSLEKHYRSEAHSGYVYRIENKGSRPMPLSSALFSHKHAQSLVLSDEVLAPKGIGYLYGLYSRDTV